LAAKLFVAGRGRVGRSLAAALTAAGYDARLVAARTSSTRLIYVLDIEPAALVFLTVPDDKVGALAEKLAAARPAIPRSVSFVHTSGALGLDGLASLARRHAVGSFHPLRSFPTPQPPSAFKGIVVAVDGSTPAIKRRLMRLARDLGARPRIVAERDRVLYHAAAVVASNYAVALLGLAVELLEEIGWTQRQAVAGLLPLMTGALEQARAKGVTGALTGPIRRGDVHTVERHLGALSRVRQAGGSARPAAIDVYRMLGAITLEIANQAGLDPAAAERMRRALTQKAAATRRRRRR
jgi:predicted short-subunit dehydrogenase-like oxidoreductase (DUF2520 family)